MPLIPDIDDADLETVLASDRPVVIDCCAPWCGPCKAMDPIISRLAANYQGYIRVVNLNTDRNRGAVKRLDIQTLPTILIVHQGVIVQRFTGIVAYERLVQSLSELMTSAKIAPV